MHKQFFISDTHFGHSNILTFKNNDGVILRQFDSIEEHDNLIIDNINKVVRPVDRITIMGDVVMYRRCLPILDRINTKKRRLLFGNHDPFQLKDYLKYFDDVRAYTIMPGCGLIFSHIPVHTRQLEYRFKFNIHGHMHGNKIDDIRYLNLCPESIGHYKPLELEEILEIKKNRGLDEKTIV